MSFPQNKFYLLKFDKKFGKGILLNMVYKFTTIINKEGKWFVARCVELGVVSQAKTIEGVQENLKEAVELYLEDRPKVKKFLSKSIPLITTLELEYV